MRWNGHAYLDSNDGDEPIERGFRRWDWLRAPLDRGSCGVVYDVQPLHGADRLVAVRFDRDGTATPLDVPAAHGLPLLPMIAMYLLSDVGSIARFSEKTTSSAVSGEPSWNLTPWRSLNCHTVGSAVTPHDVASAGSSFPLMWRRSSVS